MSKNYIKLAVQIGVLLTGFYLGTPFAFAQSNPPIVLSIAQGVLSSSTSQGYDCGSGVAFCTAWTMQVGTGYSGTTTQGVLAFSAHLRSSGMANFGSIVIAGFSDPSYATEVAQCMYRTDNLASNGDYTSGDPVALTAQYSQIGPNDCTLQSDLYYEVIVQYDANATSGGWVQPGYYYEGTPINNRSDWNLSNVVPSSVSSTVYFPYFVVLGSGWTLVPTSTDSALSLSGATEFCNGVFGTSTSIGGTIANGFCTALGYLFVPSQASVQQFSNFGPSLESKIPFSYFFDAQNIFSSLVASSTENFQDFSITLPAFGSTTAMGDVIPTHIDIISTSTISTYYPTPIRETFLFLGSCALWFGLLVSMYHRIVPNKPTL